MANPQPVILWDIDGTLLRAPGIGVAAFARSILAVTGKQLVRGNYDLGGRTDPDIARMLLDALDCGDDVTIAAVLDGVVSAYDDLTDDLTTTLKVMPGVTDVIAGLTRLDAHQSVLTGNLRAVAELKLRAGGLLELVHTSSGAYGSDHHDRAVLAALAIERASPVLGRELDSTDVWIVGDTPRDLACARAVGARCALVATGTYTYDQLADLDADVTFSDLSDVADVLGHLAG